MSAQSSRRTSPARGEALAGQLADDAAQLQHQQRLEHRRRPASRVRAMSSSTLRGIVVELRARSRVSRSVERRRRRPARAGAQVRRDLAQHVLGALDQRRPLAEQLMRAAACARRPDRAPRTPRAPARPHSWAVISEPLRSVASTTTVPSDKPLMMRLRAGKFSASGCVPMGYSDTTAPLLGDSHVAGDDAHSGTPRQSHSRAPRRCDPPARSAASCAAASIPRARPLTTVMPRPARPSPITARHLTRRTRWRRASPTTATAQASRSVQLAEHVEKQRRVVDLPQQLRVARVVPGHEPAAGAVEARQLRFDLAPARRSGAAPRAPRAARRRTAAPHRAASNTASGEPKARTRPSPRTLPIPGTILSASQPPHPLRPQRVARSLVSAAMRDLS